MKDLVEVDMDLINELRRNGKKAEASEMLYAYQKNMKSGWKQGKKEIRNIASRICRMKRPNIVLLEKFIITIDGHALRLDIVARRYNETTVSESLHWQYDKYEEEKRRRKCKKI